MDKQNIEAIYPLSHIQQGIFFHSIHQPESEAYFVQQQWIVNPQNANVQALKRAWQCVIDRHGILRTGFVWEHGGDPVQVVLRKVNLPCEEFDWRDLPAETATQRLEAFLATDRRCGFEFSRAPLTRVAFIRISESECIFLWSYHHLLLDGWSVSILLHEVFAIYEAIQDGRSLDLELPRPYHDYVLWSQSRNLSDAESFWRRYLKGFTTPTGFGIDLPAGRANSENRGYNTQELAISETTAGLSRVARKNGLTLNTLLQGAYALLMSRYSGETDVVFGTSVAGRPDDLPGSESMVGVFINTLPTRVRIEREIPVLSFLKKLQMDQVDARQYGHAPLLRIQEWSELPAGQMLFENIFSFDRPAFVAGTEVEQPDLTMSHRGSFEKTNYPLAVLATPSTREQLLLLFCYHCSRFDDSAISRLLRDFQHCLEAIATDPTRPISEVITITSIERHQLLLEWNDTRQELSVQCTLSQVFERQVRKTPDNMAVKFARATLSYSQLNSKSNQLAHYLREKGVRPGKLVNICAQRSPEMVIAILGTLKAGGAYVPLDPEYPNVRLGYMIQDSAPAMVLTQAALRDRLDESEAPILQLDADAALLSSYPTDNPDPETVGLTPDDLAYVIYTSGSTGMPKGVMNSHAGVLNALLWGQKFYQIRSDDRILQKSPFSFDVSVWEFLLPLLSGAQMVIARPDGHRDPQYLADLIESERVTIVQFVPSMLQAFLEHDVSGKCRTLRRVLCAGEALPHALQVRFEASLPAVELHNLYGPTEAAVYVTYWHCRPGIHDGIVPIGRPLANTQIYILDKDLQLAPQGVVGDVYIGGAGVAKGYWHRPDLTEQRFVPDPFSAIPHQRMYKTGDLGRWLPDGAIEYLGRSDFQVKIRGFRIELGEIESALLAHPGVEQAVVVAHEDQPGQPYLAGYVVYKHATANPSDGELREYLRERLPVFMVPAAFVTMKQLPLNPNGKIDRLGLPHPRRGKPQREHIQASTEAEKVLSAIWSGVLGREQLGIRDNFFDVGGHSINAIQIAAKARKAGYQLSTAQIFELQTIEKLAQVVAPQKSEDLIEKRVPLIPIQKWFFDLEFPSPDQFTIATLLQLPAEVESGLLMRAIEAVVNNHGAFAHRFKNDASGWRQFTANRSAFSFMEEDLAHLEGTALQSAMKSAAGRAHGSLDIANGPVLKAILFRLGNDHPCILLIVVHHLLCDITSLAIIKDDLEVAYAQLRSGRQVALEQESTSYARWAEILKTYSSSEHCKQELQYWTGVKWSRASAVPLDGAGGCSCALDGIVQVQFTEAETQAIGKVSRFHNVQIAEVLLAGLALGYQRWTGATSMLVAIERHGREELGDEVDLSRTVGWFTAISPLLLNWESAGDEKETLISVKAQYRTVPTGGIGFGALRYMSDDQEIRQQMKQIPLPEIIFNFLGQSGGRTGSPLLMGKNANEMRSALLSPAIERPFKLDISGVIEDGKLTTTILFNERLQRRWKIEALALYCADALRTLSKRCSASQAPQYTTADFPLAHLEQSEIDELVAELDGSVD